MKQALFAAVLSLLFLLFGTTASAAERPVGTSFDHVQTGFPLLGSHLRVDCQTCHLQGVFIGTPRLCDGCHTQGTRIASTFKPATHLQTTRPCVQCHTSQVTWTGARFDHIGIAPHSCATCHNGITASGKSARHVLTTAPCDNCHRTSAWVPAGFDHFGVAPSTCSTCHGVSATGKPIGHTPTVDECDKCHSTNAWKPAGVDHTTVIAGQCATCHGISSTGKKAGHIPTSLSCDACHNRAPQHFRPSIFAHQASQGVVAGQCKICHDGSYTSSNAQGKTSKHIPTSTYSCDACHTTPTAPSASFYPSTFTHQPTQGVVIGQCITCHDGSYTTSNAYGMSTQGYNHFPPVPGFTDCYNCHKSYATFTTYTFNHATQGVVMSTATVCSTCHDGSHTFGGSRLRGYQSKHSSLPNSGRCADSGCHNSFTDWSSGVGLLPLKRSTTPKGTVKGK